MKHESISMQGAFLLFCALCLPCLDSACGRHAYMDCSQMGMICCLFWSLFLQNMGPRCMSKYKMTFLGVARTLAHTALLMFMYVCVYMHAYMYINYMFGWRGLVRTSCSCMCAFMHLYVCGCIQAYVLIALCMYVYIHIPRHNKHKHSRKKTYISVAVEYA
jgi:hypothetical protein